MADPAAWNAPSLWRAEWPTSNAEEIDSQAIELFGLIQSVISGIRNVRARYNVPPGHEIVATLSVDSEELAEQMRAYSGYFRSLSKVAELTVGVGMPQPKASAAFVVGPHQVFVPLAGMVDLEVERARLRKEVEQKEKFLMGVSRKLENEQFLARAPADVVERERKKASDARVEADKLRITLAELEH